MKKRIIILAGPTAVGKTDTAIMLAQRLDGEIISADSMQVYRNMDIGTAKPSIEEKRGIPHYMLDIVNPDESFSVADFQKNCKFKIEELLLKNKIPIIAGGTGLYVNSLIYNMDFTRASSNTKLREELQMEAEQFGELYIHEKLKAIDPEAAARIHPNNIKKVIRAIEVFNETGDKIGDFSKDMSLNEEYDIFFIGLMRNREELYDRINIRVDMMIDQGLVDEVKGLLELGYTKELVSFKGLGYKEIVGYLEGEYSLDEAIRILKRDTRRYAKRQLTWFKRYENISWYNISNYSSSESLTEVIIKDYKRHCNLI